MNGRIYDPKLGRFLQADIQVQFPSDTQSYNRYSYAHNNPLRYTDSSGYGLDFFDALKIFVAVVITVACEPCGPSAYAWAMGSISAAQTAYYGGSLGDIATAAFTSAALAYVGADLAAGGITGMEALSFGALGGITTVLQGGKFGHGFISAGVGFYTGGQFGTGGSTGQIIGRTLAKTVIGGTLSKITGGKFANGAVTAAFSSVVSEGAQGMRQPTAQEVTYARLAKDVYDPQGKSIDGYSQVGDLFVDSDTGLQSALYVNKETGHSVMAFAGTNEGLDWSSNIPQAFGGEAAQYSQAIGMAQSVYNSTGGNVHFVGHSLGGGLASASAIMTGGSATTFNAAGVHSNTVGGLTTKIGVRSYI